MIRLPHSVKEHFQTWLHEHFPDRALRVINHIRDTRAGKLYDSAFGTRMRGEGIYADQAADMMALFKKRYKLDGRIPLLSTAHFNRRARDAQMSLF